MPAIKSVARRKSAVGKSAIAVKPARTRAARAVAARAAAKPRRKASASATRAAAAAVPAAPPAPIASAAAQAQVCPVCGAAKLNGAAQATKPAPPERTAKQLAADRAWLRRLYKKYPPRPLPKSRLKGTGADLVADIQKIVKKVGGFDDIFPLPNRRHPGE